MTESSYTRSRRASLYGLLLQLAVFAGVLGLAQASRSLAMFTLAWYVLGGVPLWFICLLVFRQHELVAFESLDLEELRREKRATGGGEAIFDEEGGGRLGFRVAGRPETNVVMFGVTDMDGFVRATAARRLLVDPIDPDRCRVVTHLDVSEEDVDDALACIEEVVKEGIR